MAYLPSKIAQTIENGYEFRFGDYISRGFDLINKNIWLFIGYFFVYLCITFTLAFIPIVGSIANFIIAPVLSIGVAIAAHKTYLGEPLEFADFFKGFSKTGNLFLVSLLSSLIAVAAALPGIIIAATTGFSNYDPMEGPTSILFDSKIWIGLLVAFIPAIFMTISYMYAPMLVWFHNMEPWPAMEASRKLVAKNWAVTFVFMIALGFIGAAGALLFGLGILYTMPAVQAATYAAFADITKLHETEAANEDDLIDHFVPGTNN